MMTLPWSPPIQRIAELWPQAVCTAAAQGPPDRRVQHGSVHMESCSTAGLDREGASLHDANREKLSESARVPSQTMVPCGKRL